MIIFISISIEELSEKQGQLYTNKLKWKRI